MTPDRADTTLVADILGLREGDSGSILTIGARLRQQVIETHRRTGSYPRPIIEALCSLSASTREGADAANALIFTHLVEPLSDAFEPGLSELYEAVFAQIISHQRVGAAGRPLDKALNEFGLRNEEAIRLRRLRLRAMGLQPVQERHIRLAIVFSRVTVGADVAITSVIIGTLRRRYPLARVVLIAPARIAELFAGDDHIEVLPVPYPRHGSLADRLSTWLEVLDLVQSQVAPYTNGELLFVDSDSRLTQLGLLPVTGSDDAYRIFESRSYGAGETASLGQLTRRWAGLTFGDDTEAGWPYIRLSETQRALGADAVAALRRDTRRRIVAVSFGVGGNPRKRADERFEASLLLGLIRDGHTLLVDRGIGSDRTSSDGVAGALRAEGIEILATEEGGLKNLAAGSLDPADVVMWTGGVGLFSSLIGASDLYVGYDSAFQHVAAALQVPVLAIVLGSPGPVFRQRWRPYSKGPVTVVPEGETDGADTHALLRVSLAAARSMLEV